MSVACIYVASYVDDANGALTLFGVDRRTGDLDVRWERRVPIGLRALARHPFRDVVYAVGGGDAGALVTFGVSEQRAEITGQTPTGGSTPCSVTVDAPGRHLLLVNYASGELVVFRLEGDGSVGGITGVVRQAGCGPDAERQEASHPHQVVFTRDGGRAIVVDLGADAFFVYELDERGRPILAPRGGGSAPAGAGPRHLTFVGDDLAAVADELSGTVSVYLFDSTNGALSWRGSVPASGAGRPGARNYPGDVAAAPGGRVLVSNRGKDTIGLFRISGSGPELVAEVPVGAPWPQHLAMIESRVYCAAQESGEITALTLGESVSPLGPARPVANAPSPSWLLPALSTKAERRG